MFKMHKRLAARALPLLIGLGAAGFAMGAGPASSTPEPLRCEIQVDSTNGMIVLQGVVHADALVNGQYQFKVVKAGGGGSSHIQQGGSFMAGPGNDATLGQVMLGGGGVYDANLVVTANGMTITCEQRVGGAI